MNLFESLKHLFWIQKIFRLSVVTIDSDNQPIARRRDFIITLAQIVILHGVLIIITLNSLSTFDFKSHTLNDNPIDNNAFTSIIIVSPLPIGVFCMTAIWISSLFLWRNEIRFLKNLQKLDHLLSRYMNIQRVYRESIKFNRKSLVIVTIFSISENLPGLVMMVTTGSLKFSNNPDGFDLAILRPPEEFQSSIIMMSFSLIVVFYGSLNYVIAVKELVRRVEMFDETVKNQRKDLKFYSNLMKIRVTLDQTINGLNGCYGLQQGFIVMTNIVYTVSFSYLGFLAVVVQSESAPYFAGGFVTSSIPHFLCSLISLNVGEQFNDAIKKLNRISTPIACRRSEARAVIKKLFLSAQSVEIQLLNFNVVPVNYATLSTALNTALAYLVIIFQFRILNDDSFLNQ